MDDYITGVEQVGVDPTAAVETVAPVDTHEKVDPATDVYEFKEYDLKEYDNKEFVEKPYDYGDYGDYDPVDAKPTSSTSPRPASPDNTKSHRLALSCMQLYYMAQLMSKLTAVELKQRSANRSRPEMSRMKLLLGQIDADRPQLGESTSPGISCQ